MLGSLLRVMPTENRMLDGHLGRPPLIEAASTVELRLVIDRGMKGGAAAAEAPLPASGGSRKRKLK